MKKIVSAVLLTALIASILVGFSACALKPDKNHLVNYDSMEMVWNDEFDELKSEWHSEEDGVRRGGYWDIDQVSVVNGNMVITTEYKENGKFGAGWYTGSVYTKDRFTMDSGYVEARCKMPKGQGLWGAFWLLSNDMSENGNGTEIDVVESPYYNDPNSPKWWKNTAFHTIHAKGYGEKHVSKQSRYYDVGNEIYDNYNTYGVYWDKNGYTFYVNGMRTWQTDYYPTTADEYLWLSVEIAGQHGSANPSNPKNKYTWAGEITNNAGGKNFKSEFMIDYVRCYKLKK